MGEPVPHSLLEHSSATIGFLSNMTSDTFNKTISDVHINETHAVNETDLDLNIFQRIREYFRDFSFVEIDPNATQAVVVKRTLLERFIESIPTYSFI